jgi:hypothetical protein
VESNSRPFFEEEFGFLPAAAAAGGALGGAVSLLRFFPNFFLFEVGGSGVVVAVVVAVEVSVEGIGLVDCVAELMRGKAYDHDDPARLMILTKSTATMTMSRNRAKSRVDGVRRSGIRITARLCCRFRGVEREVQLLQPIRRSGKVQR